MMQRNDETLTSTGLINRISKSDSNRERTNVPCPLRITLHNVHTEYRIRRQKPQRNQKDAAEQHAPVQRKNMLARISKQDAPNNTKRKRQD